MYLLPRSTINPAIGEESGKSNDGLGRGDGSIVTDESPFHLFTPDLFVYAYASSFFTIHLTIKR